MDELKRTRRVGATWIIGLVALLPAVYLGLAPPVAAFLMDRVSPSAEETLRVVFKPAQVVYNRAGFYRVYADWWLD